MLGGYGQGRRRRRTPGVLCVGALLLALAAAACGGDEDTGSDAGQAPDAARQTIKIALEAPLTGDQASNGIDMYNGAKLAVEEANAEGGVLGRKLALLRADDRADPEVGVQVAKEVVSEGVFAVVGPYNSSVGVENLSVYLDAGVIPLHLTANRATNSMGFTVNPKDYQVAPVEADAIAKFFDAETVAIVYDPQTYTRGIARQVRARLVAAGVDVVAYDKAEPGAESYVGLLREVMSTDPDLLYVSTYFPQGGVIAKGVGQLDSPPTCLMGIANEDPAFVAEAGLKDARLCWVSGLPFPEDYPGAGRYVDRYRASYDREPGTRGAFTYDSVNLLLDGAERAGVWDADQIRNELAHTTGFEGITGSITIDPATGNRVQQPLAILRIDEGGRFAVDEDWADFAHFGG